MEENKVILHCDADNFFASVEASLDPSLRGKCIAVCGDPTLRHGIVLAKSQKAKIMGVKTGDTIWQAKQKCPELEVVPSHYDKYLDYSNTLFDIYTNFTDKVESFGLDECWLDVTHSKIFGDGVSIANKIKEKVFNELGITISCGISFNKIFAKLGSDINKPDGIFAITKENYKEVIFNKPVNDLLMVGKNTLKKLRLLKIDTIGDLANFDKELLKYHFGVNGVKLHEWANGLDASNVSYYYDKHIPKSLSNGTTTYRDLVTFDDAKCVIRSICELLSIRLLKYNFLAQGLSLYIKYSDFSCAAKQVTIPPTLSPISLFKYAVNVLYSIYNNSPIRSITVGVFKLSNKNYVQLSFFDKDFEKNTNLEIAISKIKSKYGYKQIFPASLINESSFILEDTHFISNMSNI